MQLTSTPLKTGPGISQCFRLTSENAKKPPLRVPIISMTCFITREPP
jgi:hypothetical protein